MFNKARTGPMSTTRFVIILVTIEIFRGEEIGQTFAMAKDKG